MRRAAIVSPVRTPGGVAGGVLSALPPRRLAAAAIAGAVGRAGLDGARVDEVVFAGPPGTARLAALDAGLPAAVAGLDVESGSGTGLSALIVAAMLVRTEAATVVVAGGVGEAVPETVPAPADLAHAERLAHRYRVTRAESDEFALNSRRRAARAWRQGLFDGEIVPVVAAAPDELRHRSEGSVPYLVDRDEQQMHAETSTRALISLAPLLPGGVLTAAAVRTPGIGAAACLVVAEDRLVDLGLDPIAHMTDWFAAGTDGTVPAAAPSIGKVLSHNALSLDDVDLVEVAERSAVEVLALARQFGRHDLDSVNVNGGAMALGDTGAASGPRMVTTMLHELARRNGAFGVVAADAGPDRATAILFESAATTPTPTAPKGARFHGLRTRRSGRHRA